MEQNYMEILLEEMRSKFDLVLEGHASLHAKIDKNHQESNEKHDLTAFKIQTLNDKIDAVGIDLAAHRADTEAHPRYLVRE